MADIVLEEVTTRYPDGSSGVTDVDLSVADGEFVALTGPSGCGKSTLLHLVAGLTDITAGELRIGGDRMNERPPWRRDLGMVFRSAALYPHLSVRENLAFGLRLAKLPAASVREKVAEVAESLDLTEHLDRKPATLSGSQRQRVALGRAVARGPKALLLDEPLATVDERLRPQLQAVLSRLLRQLGMTTLYGTDDEQEALALADRVVVLDEGRVERVIRPAGR